MRTPNRAIGLILIVIAFVSIWIFDLPTEYTGLSGSLIFLFVMAIPDYLLLQRDLKVQQIIKVKAIRWYNAWIYPAMWIFIFYNKSLHLTTVLTLIIITIYGILETVRLYHNYYALIDEGILDLDSRKLIITSSDITEIETTSDGLAIHTTKYRNDLELKADDVVIPEWDELVERLQSLKSDQ